MIVFALAMSLYAQAVSSAERVLHSSQVQTGATVLLNGEVVKLVGIDSPVPGQSCRDRDNEFYRCGEAAIDAFKKVVAGANVVCRQRPSPDSTVSCGRGRHDVSLWLLREGFVVAARDASSAYREAEAEARRCKRGLWAGKFLMPDEYRKREGIPLVAPGYVNEQVEPR